MLRTLIATVATAAFATGAFAGGIRSFSAKSWDDIVAQAKEEGQVSWFVWYFQPRYREVAKAFTEEYGIEVVIPEGTHEGNIEKFLAEGNATPATSTCWRWGRIGSICSTRPKSRWGHSTTSCPKPRTCARNSAVMTGWHYAYGYWGNQTGIAYDPEKISDEDFRSRSMTLRAFFTERPGEIWLQLRKRRLWPVLPSEYHAQHHRRRDGRLA